MTLFQRTIKRISLEQYVAENCVWRIYACRVCNATVSIGFSCKCKLFVVFFDLNNNNNNNQEKTNEHVELNCAIFLWSIFFLFLNTQQMEMINSELYPAERHTVTTEDGYILTVYRIPSLKKPSNKVMLLMHGETNAMNYSKIC